MGRRRGVEKRRADGVGWVPWLLLFSVCCWSGRIIVVQTTIVEMRNGTATIQLFCRSGAASLDCTDDRVSYLCGKGGPGSRASVRRLIRAQLWERQRRKCPLRRELSLPARCKQGNGWRSPVYRASTRTPLHIWRRF